VVPPEVEAAGEVQEAEGVEEVVEAEEGVSKQIWTSSMQDWICVKMQRQANPSQPQQHQGTWRLVEAPGAPAAASTGKNKGD
jgi:hypothetical protein